MKVLITLYPWESPRLYSSDHDLKKGEEVIVSGETGNELGIVEVTGIETKDEPEEKVVRLATERDRKVFAEHEKEKKEFLKIC